MNLNESNLLISQLKNIDPNIVNEAYQIYANMINNAFTKYGGNPCSLCKETEELENNTSIPRMRNHFHGSEFGKCFRQTQYSIINPIIKDPDPINSIFLQDGHLHELVSEQLLSETYKTSHREEELIIERDIILAIPTLKQQVTIVAHTDLMLVSINGQRFVIEFKAVKDWYFKERAKKGIISNHYYGQVQCYMEGYNVDYALLFFKNRHTSEILMPIVIKKDDVYIKRRLSYLAAIQYSIQVPEIVPREYEDKKCDACKFCNYHKECWIR